LIRTPRGRMITAKTYRHLGIEPPKDRQWPSIRPNFFV
jgi:hypothetical protein